MRPCSPAAERNREPILQVLREFLEDGQRILEIGSGTGQHAVFFGRHLSKIHWSTSDREENHDAIRAWVDAAGLANVDLPLSLDVTDDTWPVQQMDAVYSANTAHIMSWNEVIAMFQGVGKLLGTGKLFCLYGPFNYGGEYTSPSNQAFDTSLKSQDPRMGIRDLDDLLMLAGSCGLELHDDIEMPANNRLLVWKKHA